MIANRFSILLFAVGACVSCHGESRSFDAPLDPMPPVGIDDHVVVVDRGRSAALLMDVTHPSDAAPTAIPVVKNPTLAVARNGHSDQLLVLSSGQSDDGVHAPENPGLTAVSSNGTSKTYPFEKNDRYTGIAQSDDGRFAFLFFDPARPAPSESVLSQSDRIAVVDLTLDPSSNNPSARDLRSFGSSPSSVAFGTMTLHGAPRDLAVVLFDSDVAILDLDNLERSEFTIQLERQNTPGFHLEQTLFASDQHKIYLRATGSDDIYVVTLSDAQATSGADAGGKPLNDFTPSVNPIGGGSNPSDMALYTVRDPTTGDTETRLLVASSGSNNAIIIEPDSGTSVDVPLPFAGTRILTFQGPKPGDPTPAPRALFYSPGATTLEFLDLVKVESRGALNVQSLTMKTGITGALTFPAGVATDPNTVMLIHQDTGLSQLNLSERTLTEIKGPNLASAVADPVNRKLWVKAGDRIGFLDLGATGGAAGNGASDSHPGEVRVDAPIVDLVTVPTASPDASHHAHLFVTYQNALGWGTVLDATDPSNTSAEFSIRGYLLSGALAGSGQ